MIKKSVNKLVGLKKEEFDQFVTSGQIQLQPARLIPALRTGDEMALTSILLSALKLIKAYRDIFFKEVKLKRKGRFYFYTEAKFKDISSAKIDGLIIVVSGEKIVDAAFLEMKSRKNCIDKEQIEKYIDISKKLKVGKLITISNEFVTDSSQSPVKVRTFGDVTLSHFSWTYLITKAQLLLFKNDMNIADKDQVEIMKEVLYYFEHKDSGTRGYAQMKPGWKELAENIQVQKPLKSKDSYIEDAVLSWYEQEKNMALLLSRKLGVMVRPSSSLDGRLKKDIGRMVKENYIEGHISVEEAVSEIKIKAEFERRVVSMSIKVIPPQDRRNSARITWISNQFEKCCKRSEELFEKNRKDIFLESNIKYKQANPRKSLEEITAFSESSKDLNDIQAFHIVLVRSFGTKFASQKKVIEMLDLMILEFYEFIVQHMVSWKKPAPKLLKLNEKSGKLQQIKCPQ